jgi:hypothetical protein
MKNTRTSTETAPVSRRRAAPSDTGQPPPTRANPLHTRASLPLPESGRRGNLPNTAPYALRAGAPAIPYGHSLCQEKGKPPPQGDSLRAARKQPQGNLPNTAPYALRTRAPAYLTAIPCVKKGQPPPQRDSLRAARKRPQGKPAQHRAVRPSYGGTCRILRPFR